MKPTPLVEDRGAVDSPVRPRAPQAPAGLPDDRRQSAAESDPEFWSAPVLFQLPHIPTEEAGSQRSETGNRRVDDDQGSKKKKRSRQRKRSFSWHRRGPVGRWTQRFNGFTTMLMVTGVAVMAMLMLNQRLHRSGTPDQADGPSNSATPASPDMMEVADTPRPPASPSELVPPEVTEMFEERSIRSTPLVELGPPQPEQPWSTPTPDDPGLRTAARPEATGDVPTFGGATAGAPAGSPTYPSTGNAPFRLPPPAPAVDGSGARHANHLEPAPRRDPSRY